jgi:membrane-associated phospholipid phosphatase
MRCIATLIGCLLATSHPHPASAQVVDGTSTSVSSDGGTSEPADTTPPAGTQVLGTSGASGPIVASDDKPFARLFQHLFSDLRRLPSTDAAATVGIGAVLSLSALPIDDYVTDHATAGGTEALFHMGGAVGGGYVQVGAAVAVYLTGRVTDAPRVSHVGADLIRAHALNGFLTHGLKLAVRRDRPGGAPGRVPATYSFPSAHASTTWTTTTVLWRDLGWKVGVPMAALATYVSGSRIQQKQHFLSDVIFGAAVGVASGRRVTMGHPGRQVVLMPIVVPGGAGLALVTP